MRVTRHYSYLDRALIFTTLTNLVKDPAFKNTLTTRPSATEEFSNKSPTRQPLSILSDTMYAIITADLLTRAGLRGYRIHNSANEEQLNHHLMNTALMKIAKPTHSSRSSIVRMLDSKGNREADGCRYVITRYFDPQSEQQHKELK